MTSSTSDVVVAINKFVTDTDGEIALIEQACRGEGADFALCECWEKGGKGAVELAKQVVAACDKGGEITFAYDMDDDIKTKIFKVATKVYGAAGVEYAAKAEKSIKKIVRTEEASQ